MKQRRRCPGGLLAFICAASVHAAPISAQQATPDTAAARRIVDSLVNAGAWRITADTVRVPPDTIVTQTDVVAATLRISGFIAALLVLAALAVATFMFANRFLRAIELRGSIGVRSRWGGFGAGDDGWEITPAMTLLAATLLLAVLTTVLATAVLGTIPQDPQSPSAAAIESEG